MTRAEFRYNFMAIPWQAPLIAAAVSTVLVVVRAGQSAVFPLQAGAILLAGAAGFAFDDTSFELLAASPTALWRRRVGRLAVIVPPTVMLWALLVAFLGTESDAETLTLIAMFAGLLGMGLGISAVAGRRTRGRGGAVAAPAILLAPIVSSVFPAAYRPLPLGDVPGGWAALQTRWTAVAVVGVLTLLASSKDAIPTKGDLRKRRQRVGTDV